LKLYRAQAGSTEGQGGEKVSVEFKLLAIGDWLSWLIANIFFLNNVNAEQSFGRFCII
jgi:hypothetical protein